MPLQEVIVLYEDSAAIRPEDFGPHRLLVACVHDNIDGDILSPRKSPLQGRPLNGDGKVYKACMEDLEDIASRGQKVIAVIDGDKAARLAGLSKDAKECDIKKKLLETFGNPGNLEVAIIYKNIESLIEAAKECDDTIGLEHVRNALNKVARGKGRNSRDIILKGIATSSKKAIRDCVMEKVVSFKNLVSAAIRLLNINRS